MAGQQQARTGSVPVQWGAVHGAVAFVLGYALTYALLAVEDVTDTFDQTVEFVGWIFFNAQFVGIEGGGDATANWLSFLAGTEDGIGLPAIAFSGLIAVVLIGAGYRLAATVSGPQTTTDEATVDGAAIVAGYLPLVVLGALLFEISQAGTSFSPDIFAAVLLAGIVFPAFLGAIGGYLAVRTA
jgi:hypothetical protein